MKSEKTPLEVWEDSGSRSFYNSPHYAKFSENQGNTITFLRIGEGASQVLLPVARPHVWTYWGKTIIPVPPPFAPTHSIYLGVLLPSDYEGFSFSNLLQQTSRLKWSKLFPEFSFVQPVLIESGPADFLEQFCSDIRDSKLEYSDTHSRVLKMEPLTAESSLHSSTGLSDDELHDSTNFDTILSGYASKRRYDIRRAQREGVTVAVSRVDSDEMARSIYSSIIDMHYESWTRTGLGPHTLQYWIDLSRAVRDSGGHDLVCRAYDQDGEILAVTVVHVQGKSTFYQMNSSSLKGQKLSANPYCLHAAITASNFWGAEYFELGRSSMDASAKSKSISAYKNEFGGDSLPVPNGSAVGLVDS